MRECCIEYIKEKMPKILPPKEITIVPYFLRHKEEKRLINLGTPIRIYINLHATNRFKIGFKKQLEEHIYGSKIPDIESNFCRKCKSPYYQLFLSYIKQQIITKMIEFIGFNARFFNSREKEMVVQKIEELSDQDIDCDDWKGKYTYLSQILEMPYCLRNVIDRERYLERKKLDLTESIYCHPKASHGFAYELWAEFEEMVKSEN